MTAPVGDRTPEQRERLAAWVLVPRPRWMNPVMWVLLTVPRCAGLAERLHDYDLRRAVRVYRAQGPRS